MMRGSRASPFHRTRSIEAVHHWLSHCNQNLLVIGPPFCGKTYFARQLQAESGCAAAHYCQSECAESTESATLVRSVAAQLSKKFPNLVLPNISTVTLLGDYSDAIRQYLTLPLASLPQPSKPMFIIVDDVDTHAYDVVLELVQCLPDWLRLVITSRPVSPTEQFRFKDFHQLVLSENVEELHRFVDLRLPQCIPDDVIQACQESWFFVDHLARCIDCGLLPADPIPSGQKDLIDEICDVMPVRLPIYLLLIKSCRFPPSFNQLLAASQLIISDVIGIIEQELADISIIFETRDPITLSGAWREVEGQLGPYHSAWAEIYKAKPRKQPQDIVELAYHLAHSTVPPLEAIRTLVSVGADDVIMKCSVIDIPTSILLIRSGATILDVTSKEDFVFSCSTGNIERVREQITKTSTMDLCSGLLAASSRGHLAVVDNIIATKPQATNFVSADQWNALRSAACNNNLQVLDLLIENGANVDECGHGGRTALRAAAWAGHSDVVSRLLSAGAAVDGRDAEGRTALMAAAFMDHTDIVDKLIEFGANIGETDSADATALHLVLSNGSRTPQHDATIQLLIEKGSDVNLPDAHGRQCIHLAAFHQDSNLAMIIEKTRVIDAQDGLGRTALMLAASQGRQEAVEVLVTKGADMDCIDSHGRTALQLAAAGGHLAVVDLLLTLGADEAHKDNDGAVALHFAVVHNDVTLTRALATAATVEEIDRLGQHPLIIAAQHNNEEVVRELLSLGAPLEKQALDGQTAMRVAALGGNTAVVHVLSEFITDWDQRDLDGTPLVHTLIINKQTAMAELLLSLGAFHSATDAHGRTCAHIACSMNDITSVKMLRRLAASFEVDDEGGRTPLMTAVWAGHTKMTSYLLDTVGVDPNSVDDQGASPLSVAAQLGHRDLVVILLRFGAEPTLRDKMGRTALDVAKISGQEHIRAILQAATGSADSSGFGSMPNSPMDTKSLGRKSFRKSQKLTVTSPRIARRIL